MIWTSRTFAFILAGIVLSICVVYSSGEVCDKSCHRTRMCKFKKSGKMKCVCRPGYRYNRDDPSGGCVLKDDKCNPRCDSTKDCYPRQRDESITYCKCRLNYEINPKDKSGPCIPKGQTTKTTTTTTTTTTKAPPAPAPVVVDKTPSLVPPESCLVNFAPLSFGKRPGQASKGHRCHVISGVPSNFNIDIDKSFYKRYTHAYNIPILGSAQVTDEGMKFACYMVRNLFASRYDVRDAFYRNNGRIALIADNEKTRSIPEHSHLGIAFDRNARGMGGTMDNPVSTAGDDNTRCSSTDRMYPREGILVHELAHGLMRIAAVTVIEGFATRLRKAYKNAMSKRMWRLKDGTKTYAATDEEEYWASGVTLYFNYYQRNNFYLGSRQTLVKDRDTLRAYDIDLFNLIEEIFPCQNTLIPRCDLKPGDERKYVKMHCTSPCSECSAAKKTSANEFKWYGKSLSSISTCKSYGACPYGGKCYYPPQDCVDKIDRCYLDLAMCTTDKNYMIQNCRRSCGLCDEEVAVSSSSCSDSMDYASCNTWKKAGQCKDNKQTMKAFCAKTCNLC